MPKEKKIGFPLLYLIYFKFVDLKIVSFFFLDVLSFSKVFGIIAFLYVAFSNRKRSPLTFAASVCTKMKDFYYMIFCI